MGVALDYHGCACGEFRNWSVSMDKKDLCSHMAEFEIKGVTRTERGDIAISVDIAQWISKGGKIVLDRFPAGNPDGPLARTGCQRDLPPRQGCPLV